MACIVRQNVLIVCTCLWNDKDCRAHRRNTSIFRWNSSQTTTGCEHRRFHIERHTL